MENDKHILYLNLKLARNSIILTDLNLVFNSLKHVNVKNTNMYTCKQTLKHRALQVRSNILSVQKYVSSFIKFKKSLESIPNIFNITIYSLTIRKQNYTKHDNRVKPYSFIPVNVSYLCNFLVFQL